MVKHTGHKSLRFTYVHLTVGQKQNEQFNRKQLKFCEILIVICCKVMERIGRVPTFTELIEENQLTVIESIIYHIKGELVGNYDCIKNLCLEED